MGRVGWFEITLTGFLYFKINISYIIPELKNENEGVYDLYYYRLEFYCNSRGRFHRVTILPIIFWRATHRNRPLELFF